MSLRRSLLLCFQFLAFAPTAISTLIPVLVTGIQPRRVCAVKNSLAFTDVNALDPCDEHRDCLSGLCFTALEAWMIPRVATLGIMRSRARTGMGLIDRPHQGPWPHQLRIAC
jgi:hypothetical protein